MHSQHFVPTERLASVIALCNQDTLRGEFTILNIKSLKTNKKVGARVLALDGSPEFLESLSKTKKDHKFRLSNKRFYISGGVRLQILSCCLPLIDSRTVYQYSSTKSGQDPYEREEATSRTCPPPLNYVILCLHSATLSMYLPMLTYPYLKM